MSTKALFVIFCGCLLFGSCMTSRYTTHWIVNNYSDTDISFNLSVVQSGSGHNRTRTHTVKPGLREIGSDAFSKGTYSVVAATNEVSKTSKLHIGSDTWVIINFTKEDSINIYRRFGYVDTSSLKKVNGKFTGVDIYNETRKPPMLYTAKAHK